MNADSVLSYALLSVVLLLVLVLSLGYVLGHPVVLSYAESGSMEPAIEEGDGVVLVPSQGARSPGVGDVVTFQAELVNGGSLTTHRVVEVTEEGYVTKGDANPFTDQDTGEPAVTEAQVVGVVPTFRGEPVTVPGLGTFVESTRAAVASLQMTISSYIGTSLVTGTQGLAYILFGVGATVFVLTFLLDEDDERTESRDTDREGVFSTWTVVLVATLFVVFVVTGVMVSQGGPTKYELVSSESDPDTPRVVQAGESVERRYVMSNPGHIPAVSFVEPASNGVEVDEENREHYLGGNETVNATVTLNAPSEKGYYPMYVVEHRYFAVLPTGTIEAMYAIHPWVPIVVINGLVAGAFVVFSAVLVGTKPVRTRTKKSGTLLRKKDRG